MSSPLEPSKSSDVIVAKTAVGMPIAAVVFIAFLVIAQFAASLFSRFWAGNYADSRGAKRALVTGLLVAAAAGPIAPFRRRTEDVSHDPAPGPGGTRRGGELHRHRGVRLGIGARGATEYRPDYGLGRDGDVRRLRGRRAGRNQPVRRPWLRGDRARDDADPAIYPTARRTAPPSRAIAPCPP
jgi:hypothetical protein